MYQQEKLDPYNDHKNGYNGNHAVSSCGVNLAFSIVSDFVCLCV